MPRVPSRWRSSRSFAGARECGGLEGGKIDAECDVGRVLGGGDEGEFALADAEEGPGGVGVEDFGAEVFDVEVDGAGDVFGGEGDVVHFEHGELKRKEWKA